MEMDGVGSLVMDGEFWLLCCFRSMFGLNCARRFANSEVEVWYEEPPLRLCGLERTIPFGLERSEAVELDAESMESGVVQSLVWSLRTSSSVRIPVDLESILMLEGAMLTASVSVSMLSSDCTLRMFGTTIAGCSVNPGTLLW